MKLFRAIPGDEFITLKIKGPGKPVYFVGEYIEGAIMPVVKTETENEQEKEK